MMIGLIVGFVFLAIVGGAITLAILSHKRRNRVYQWVGVGVSAAFAVLFLFIPFSFHTVNPGEIAVVKHLGKASAVRTSGTYFDFWITDQYDTYDAKVQNLAITANTYSKDAQTMDIAMTVQFQIKSDKGIEIAERYGDIAALTRRLESVAIEKTKATLSSYSAMEIIEKRSAISPQVETVIKDAVDESFYVTIEKVVLTNIDFSDAFEQTVEDKMIAEQEKLKAEYEKETAIIKAEQELEVAKKQAEARIEAARGDAEARLLVAQAEANAIQAKSIEIARALGFTITETKAEDDSVTYKIDFTGKTAEEIKLISDYLKYVEYLQTWDGKLPNVVVNDGNATLLLPSGSTGLENNG
ncbi:MAG: hypothetical protein K2N84_05610 [Clostridia bacterium]|nr:hypothetical protein [Clostridia bacterium]